MRNNSIVPCIFEKIFPVDFILYVTFYTRVCVCVIFEERQNVKL